MCSATTARIGVYVNCWQHRSLYSVLQAIIDDFKVLGAEAQDTNVKLGRIQQVFRGRPAVIVLDEIDRPMPAARDAIIYGLLRLPHTGLICIAESTRALAMLDERVRSRLGSLVIELPPYTTNQIRQIVTDRARRALMPGSWSPAIIRRLAAGAAGDARLAIQGLRHAAAAAEDAGHTTLDSRSTEGYLRQWQAIRQEARFTALPG